MSRRAARVARGELLPPHSPEAEMALLGSMILDPSIIPTVHSALGHRAVFFEERHSTIFDALLLTHADHGETDLVPLAAELRRRGDLENIGGAAYLTRLAEQVPSAANWPHYANVLLDMWRRRELIAVGMRLSTGAADLDPAAVVLAANERIAQIMRGEPTEPLDEPRLLRLSDVAAQRVRWRWQGRIPRGRLTLLVGRPGEGKSFATTDWAARVTTGRPWPDGAVCERGDVLLVSGEDDPGDTIRPRLDAHGADAARVHLLQSVRRTDARGRPVDAAFTLENLGPLERALAALPDCALVIVDPIGSFVGGRVDAHRDNEVRAVLAPLAALAQRTGTAVLLVAHQRKGAASHADDLVLGSRAFTGIARSVLHLMSHPDDDERKVLLPGKMNLSRPAPGLAFTINGDPPRLTWESGEVTLTADALLAAQAGPERGGRTDCEDAAAWLRDYLADGPKLARDVLTESKAAGFSKRTIDRAKPKAGVRTRKEAFGGGWVWELGEPAQERQPEDRHTPDAGNLGRKPDESGEDHPKTATHEGLATFDGLDGNLGGTDADAGRGVL